MTSHDGGVGAEAGSTVGAVSALMDERRRYESWIAALDQKRASTPDHVFTRVHADYQSRLDGVVARLATHADGLRDEIQRLTSQLAALRDEHRQATDERAEAELRAHVGELSAEDWGRLAAACDTRLAGLAAQGGDIERELSRTRELLADTERPAATPAPVPDAGGVGTAQPVTGAAPWPVEQLEVGDVAEASLHVPAAVADSPGTSQASTPDEHQAEPSTIAAVAPPAPQPPRASVSVAQPPRSSGGFDELSFLRSVVDAPPGPVEASPRDEPDEDAKLNSFARRSREEAVQHLTGEQPLIMRSSGEELARDSQAIVYQRTPGSALDPIKDPAIEGAKTLKCGECGALNYPTEWYCERCGAELASL